MIPRRLFDNTNMHSLRRTLVQLQTTDGELDNVGDANDSDGLDVLVDDKYTMVARLRQKIDNMSNLVVMNHEAIGTGKTDHKIYA